MQSEQLESAIAIIALNPTHLESRLALTSVYCNSELSKQRKLYAWYAPISES